MFSRFLSVLCLSVLTSGAIHAQDYPSRAITLIVPYAAGGPVDTVARVLASSMAEHLGQKIIIENIGGAGGMTGSARAAAAPPDGYRILNGGSAVLAINQSIDKKPLVDGGKDFTLVSLYSDQPRILVVRKDFPAKDLREFNAYEKANHAKLQYGTAGAGSGTHVCALMMDAINGTKVTHVPYRGSSQAMQDLVAGRLDFIAEQIATAIPQVDSGAIRALAVLGPERSPAAPNLPTSTEQGMDGLDCGAWGAMALPKGTPDAIVRKIADATNRALESPLVRERFTQMGVSIPPEEKRTVEFLNKYVPEEIERWAKIIKAAGIILE